MPMPRNDSVKSDGNYVGLQEPDVAMAAFEDTAAFEPASAKPFQIKSPLLRECLAEFIGTMVMIMFGDGVVAQTVLSDNSKGSYLAINLCWGLAVLFGIHFSGGVSGAHLNPAVTTTLAIFGRFPWKKVIPFAIAQVLGAFVASVVIYIVYYPMFNAIDPDRESTQGVFATYPYSDDVPVATCFLTEVVGSALLLGGIFAIGDELNKPASPYTSPSAVALLVVAIGMAFGMNSGYAINPARDFGPRLFSLCAGWGSKVFTTRGHYFWVPIVGPLLGSAVGGGIYVGLVEYHHPRN